ncbi:MAG: hypothetical protein IVW51_09620 [Thermaceae bacterium]|nr:hypothetical protein [Thermaceae bacterium]
MKSKILLIVGILVLGAALAYGPRWAGGMGQGGQPAVAAGLQGTLHDEAAAILGITPEELIALHREGKTLIDIAKELGVDTTKFEARLVEVRNEAIDQAVTAGTLSSQQATLMKTRTQAIVKATLTREVGPDPASGAQNWGKRTNTPVGPGMGYGPGSGAGGRSMSPQFLGPRWNR